MANKDGVKPRWVLVDGALRPVSAFAMLKRGRRPAAVCPACSRPVILKLGKHRVHHYAHTSGTLCGVSQAESALHANVKYYIHDQLLQASTLLIQEPCTGGCGTTRERLWLRGWDDVRVEHRLGGTRPDITLFLAGHPIGAIEVLVRHNVTPEKEAYLADAGIPCVEIAASEELYSGDARWTVDRPLPCVRVFPASDAWECGTCQEKRRLRALRTSRPVIEPRPVPQPELLPAAPVPADVTREACMVDLYFKTKKKYRDAFYIVELRAGPNAERILIVRNRKWKTIAQTPSGPDALEKMRQAVKDHLDTFRARGAIVDICVDWTEWTPGKKFAPRNFLAYPLRYGLDESGSAWKRIQPSPPPFTYIPSPVIQPAPAPPAPFHSAFFSDAPLPCEQCGRTTSDYAVAYHARKTCLCRTCMNGG